MIWIIIIILSIPFFYAEFNKEKLDKESKQATIDIAKNLEKIANNSNNK